MELNSRIGKEQIRNRISEDYYRMRELDHKVKTMQMKLAWVQMGSTEEYLDLARLIKVKLQELADQCIGLGLCPPGTPYKKLPYGYG